jgi:hypothetical protein
MRTDQVCPIGHTSVNDVFWLRIWNSARPRPPDGPPPRASSTIALSIRLAIVEEQNQVWGQALRRRHDQDGALRSGARSSSVGEVTRRRGVRWSSQTIG